MERDEDFSTYMVVRWSALVRSAVLLGCNPQEAEDLVQTALTRCYISWSRVSKADNRDAYVYRVLTNCHADSRRRRWSGERPSAEPRDQADPTDATANIDVVDAVERALGALSAANRVVVVLRIYAHLSEQQTAEVLGVARGTVKSRLSRALAQLSRSEHLTELPDGKQHD
jgi:RNA polymerase sigma-70 factor (sigma-E family)